MTQSVRDHSSGAPSTSTAAQREGRPVVFGEPAMGMGLLIVSGLGLGGAIGAVLLFALQFGAPGGMHLWVDIAFALVTAAGAIAGAALGAIVGSPV